MQELGPATGITSAEDILKIAKDALRDKITKLIDGDVEPEKVEQYRKARRNDFYWRGVFDIAPTRVSDQVVDFTQIGIPTGSDRRKDSDNLSYNFNIIRGDFIKAIAVIGSKAPDVSAVPDEADDESQLDIARRADLVDHKLTNSVDMDGLQAELMLDLSLTSTTFIHTPWVVDGDRFGWSEEPILEPEQSEFGQGAYKCVQCGAETSSEEAAQTGVCSNPDCRRPLTPEEYQDPQQMTLPKESGTQRFPNGGVDFQIRNIFTASGPFFARKLKNCEWWRDEEDVTPSAIMEIFPDIDKSLLEKSYPNDQSGYGTQVRQQVSSESGIRRQRSNTVRFSKYWLRPSFFNNFRDDEVDASEEMGAEKQNLAKLLKDRFKRGVRVTLVNGEVMDLFEESIDDVWAECKPTVSKYLFCDPLCHDTIPIQELINRTGNIGVATLLRGLPALLVESELFDRETYRTREAISGELFPVKRRTGQRLEDSIAQVPQARFSDQQMPFMAGIRQMSRENNGISEQLAGGGPAGMTAHEAEIRKQQSLMQLRLSYNNTRFAWAKARENAVRQYARYAPGQMKADPQQGILGPEAGEMVEISDLIDGKFHFEPDEGMPRTFEDERESFRELMTGATQAPPVLLHAIGADSPVNLPKVAKFFGMSGEYYPGKDERSKLLRIIPQLLAGQQIQPDPWDDAAILAGLMAAWLNSPNGGAKQQQANPQGFQAAVAYWQACQQAANPQKPEAKVSISTATDKPVSPEGAQILGELGINVNPSPQPPPMAALPPKLPAKAGKTTMPPGPPPGGMGLPVPEPANPIPMPTSPIPNA